MTKALLAGLVLVDVPFVVAALVIGWPDPVGQVVAWYHWREQHPWTLLLTIPLVALVAYRHLPRKGET